MITQIVQLREVWDDDGPILDLCVKFYFTKKDLYMPDKFSKLLTGNKTAKVGREIVETIGGPGYSSVKVSTYIEVTCDQSEKIIKEAAKHCLDEALILNEEGILDGYAKLLEHRKTLGLKDEG